MKRAVGRIFQIPEQANVGIINQALLKVKIDDRKASDLFFFHVFDSDQFQERIVDNTHGGAMPNLVGMDTFKNTMLPMPNLPEQRAIAAALSDVDALISSLDRLISKKRAVKTAAMQQLLTGKRRLPGFSGEWETKLLGDVGAFQSGNGFPVAFQGEVSGYYPFFKVSDMNNVGNSTYMVNANNRITDSVRKQVRAYTFPGNSIVFAKIGAAVFLERKRWWVQPVSATAAASVAAGVL